MLYSAVKGDKYDINKNPIEGNAEYKTGGNTFRDKY